MPPKTIAPPVPVVMWSMPPMPGAVDLLDALQADGRPIGLATNSRRDFATRALEVSGLAGRFDIVLSAPDALRRHGDLIYLIVGEGESLDAMKALARARGVADRFRFEPFVEYALMPRYLSLADLALMPSEREGM